MRRAPALSLLTATLALACSACESGGGYPEAASISASGYSSSGPSASVYSGASEVSIPQRSGVRADLIVRPDLITVVFVLKEAHADPQEAIASLQGAVSDMERRLKEATAGAAQVRMCGVAIRPEPTGKAADDEDEPGKLTVLVDGSVDVGLAPGLDFWARSRLLAAITRVTREIHRASKGPKESKETKPERVVQFNEPSVTLKDPEVYRAKLTEKWVRRAKDFAEAAQAGQAPLNLIDCAPPARIEQAPISLEEVGLTLGMTCKIDALGPPKDRAAP